MMRPVLLLLLLSPAFATAVWAQETVQSPNGQPAAQQAPSASSPATGQQGQAQGVAQPAAPASVTNAITRAAVAQGVLTCAARINQVTNYIGYNDNSGAILMPSGGPQADQRLLPVIMEIQSGAGVAYASATFAPNQANGCGATYDAVAYWPLKCDQVAAKQFSSLKKVGPLRKDVTVLDGGVATKVFLMTAGAGCMSIKKELVL